jgi:hypothetical protein
MINPNTRVAGDFSTMLLELLGYPGWPTLAAHPLHACVDGYQHSKIKDQLHTGWARVISDQTMQQHARQSTFR